MARKLTERQQKFLDVLIEEANGSVTNAKIIAGYSPATSLSEIIRSMKDEIMEATQTYLARNAPIAAYGLVGGIENPTELGIREKLNASKEVLDRVGLVKTEKVQVEASGGVMLLPAKEQND